MHRLILALLCVLLAQTALPAPASAQLSEGAVDLRLFRPAVDSRGLLSANGTDVLGHGAVSFGLVLDAGFGTLPYRGFVDASDRAADDAERRTRLIDFAATGTLQANVGLFGPLVVGAQLPVQLVAGPDVTVPGVYNDPAAGGANFQGLGDLSLHLKGRLTRPERDGLGLALLLRTELPTGSPERLGGGGFALLPEVALELRPHRFLRIVANAGARIPFADSVTFPLDGRTEPGNEAATGATVVDVGTAVRSGSALTARLGVGVRPVEPLELVVEVYASHLLSDAAETAGLSAELLAGARLFVDGRSYLYAAVGPGLPPRGTQASDVRATLGFVFEPSVGDRDGDGYRDDDDRCPDEPEDFDGFGDEDGCPDLDDDRDGILDDDDACRLVPEDRDGDADEDGCPEGNDRDRDGDGLLDAVDACPDEPEDRDGFEDEDGCPDLDNDRDGIVDQVDLCPDDPEDRDGFEDEDGCPDPDNDADRILDADDACPDRRETYNGLRDGDGCPDESIVALDGPGIRTFEEIRFATDSAEILPESAHIIEALAGTLHSADFLRLVEVGGHADERGSDDYNLRLTRDRAAAVRLALIDRGVAPERLTSHGFGETCPTNPGHGPAAWRLNRRVELRILENDRGAVLAPRQCLE